MHGPHRFVSLLIGLALVAAALAFSACGSAGTSTPARSASPASSPGAPTSSPGTLRDQQDRLSITYDPKRLAARVTRSFGRTFITLRVLGSGAMPDTLKIQPEMYGSLLDSNASISAWIQAHSSDPHTSATRLNGVRGLMTSHAPHTAHARHTTSFARHTGSTTST